MAADMMSDKPTLVLLHGWGMNQGVWRSVTSQFEHKVSLLTPDLPGFGLSQQYPIPYQLNAVIELLAEQIPDDSYLCGWSLGGLLAISLAKRFPHKVKQLGLVAASPCFVADAHWPGMAEHVLQQFAQALSNNLTQTIERFLAIQAMGSSNAREDIKALRQAIMAYPAAQPEAVVGALQLLKLDLRAEFAALTQPISGIFGRLDALVPADVVDALQLLNRNAQLSVIEHASHAPFISHPEAFNHWLSDWVGVKL
ncbi:MAG: pimeloyl-[acyl-carrier protein] methyl ester esterase [Alteromonadaceae bacterium]|jgi:pimeloyl-[acyl-carrier protein] methyl ester esterase|nr:pimeloyl-[acyl-carrier protein] methyl ester esterase [Alteromonadaceae bacterium]HBN90748.1 pimeloyl-[acyl-carrier protein] methyl ester esterase [Rheinheimera sp.]|tara:strand:- start:6167 stop:6928 length:762 start_codon:yes stop_codon:yes gene_type:complete